MGVKWTKQQQQVIDLRDRNILVSAAAGSGKKASDTDRHAQEPLVSLRRFADVFFPRLG